MHGRASPEKERLLLPLSSSRRLPLTGILRARTIQGTFLGEHTLPGTLRIPQTKLPDRPPKHPEFFLQKYCPTNCNPISRCLSAILPKVRMAQALRCLCITRKQIKDKPGNLVFRIRVTSAWHQHQPQKETRNGNKTALQAGAGHKVISKPRRWHVNHIFAARMTQFH